VLLEEGLVMKVLLSAYACEPGKGSEPGVGWNRVRQIARFAEVWVITRSNNREAIEKALAEEPLPNVHWVYFDLPRWARFWKKGQRGVHFYYYLWQVGIYFLARRLQRQVGFDLVHHVTFVNYWLPSFLALLPVPFIWGPVGGGESAPKIFFKTFSFRGKLYEIARDIARWIGEHDPFTRMTARKASIALATTNETAKRLTSLGARRVEVLSEVAFPSAEIEKLSSLPPHLSSPFRLISMGRLLHWKGFHLGLRAFAQLVQDVPDSEYWIVGDGPERKNLERLARKLGIIDKVRFWGALPRSEALKKLSECDVLVHPSLHDSGGWVCVEAMAAGRPVICLDLGGPALQVTEETGFKIPACAPEQVIEDMAEAMKRLAKDAKLRRKMGEEARRRVGKEFSWNTRGQQLQEIYSYLMKYFIRKGTLNVRT
jgi:glycosyltransferase involved in cell wall biosynthesis